MGNSELNQKENIENQSRPSGPVFDEKPNKPKSRYFLFIIILLVLAAVGGLAVKTRPWLGNNKNKNQSENIAISQIVEKGDGHALVSRHALAQYLKNYPSQRLTNGQKIFIEEKLRQTVKNVKLVVGQSVRFQIQDIQSAIEQSKELTPFQLEKWNEYAKHVLF